MLKATVAMPELTCINRNHGQSVASITGKAVLPSSTFHKT